MRRFAFFVSIVSEFSATESSATLFILHFALNDLSLKLWILHRRHETYSQPNRTFSARKTKIKCETEKLSALVRTENSILFRLKMTKEEEEKISFFLILSFLCTLKTIGSSHNWCWQREIHNFFSFYFFILSFDSGVYSIFSFTFFIGDRILFASPFNNFNDYTMNLNFIFIFFWLVLNWFSRTLFDRIWFMRYTHSLWIKILLSFFASFSFHSS